MPSKRAFEWSVKREMKILFFVNMMTSFFLPEGYQSSHKAQHQEALPGRWLCGEGTAKDHFCALWCYEYQGSGTRRHEWGRQQQVQVWSWLKSKEIMYSCFRQEFCVNFWKINQFSTWSLSRECSHKGVGMVLTHTVCSWGYMLWYVLNSVNSRPEAKYKAAVAQNWLSLVWTALEIIEILE